MARKVERRGAFEKKYMIALASFVVLYMFVMGAMMLCIAGLVGLLTYSSWVSPFLNAQTIRDWEDYDKYREGLFLFPEARPEATINDYFYMNAEFKYPQEHKVFNLYLDVTYNAEEYAAELQRFQSYSQNYVVEGEAMTGMLIYDKDDVYFNYETYIDYMSTVRKEDGKMIFDSLQGDKYFKRLMDSIAEFFVTGKPSVDPEQTCTVCAIVDALRTAEKTPGEWVKVLR